MEKVIFAQRGKPLQEIAIAGSEILGAYKEGIKSYSENARKKLDVFSDSNGDIAGSNCFAPLELREYLPKGTKLVTMADLDGATQTNPNFLSRFCSDTGLVLRTAEDSHSENDLLAKVLAAQLEERGMPLAQGTPKIIYFDALDLKEDKEYGLVYVLNERAEKGKSIIDAPELMNDYNFITMDERGVPIKSKYGGRSLFIRKNGLSRFWLVKGSYVDSDHKYLANSSDAGRVVVVKDLEEKK